jgi:hypothetical protein
MENKKLKKYQQKIEEIKRALLDVGDMRPGSLTQQTYRKGNHERRYWQISYTQKQRSKTEYVRDNQVDAIREEIAEYNRFKKLTAEWVNLAIELSKEKVKIKKEQNST